MVQGWNGGGGVSKTVKGGQEKWSKTIKGGQEKWSKTEKGGPRRVIKC